MEQVLQNARTFEDVPATPSGSLPCDSRNVFPARSRSEASHCRRLRLRVHSENCDRHKT